MCGRFTQDYSWQEMHDHYNLTGPALNLRPSYNVAPTQEVHTVCAEAGERTMRVARWGLVPGWWKKPLKDLPSTFNARSETAAEKPMFRSAFRHRRCIVPAGGFYEWKRSGDEKQPFFIHSEDGAPLSFAGLWETWRDPDTGDEVRSCTILTTAANTFMARIHSRMPVIVGQGKFDTWLDGSFNGPFDPDEGPALDCHPVAKAVGNVRNNSATLIEPVDA